jgi:ketosteroid isomerase-like protein
MTGLNDQDFSKIKDLHNLWIAKELEGNRSELVDLCTDDIQWLPSDSAPIVGKEEIAKYLLLHSVKLEEIDITNLTVKGNGSFAYLTANYLTRYFTDGQAEVHEAKGTHLWVLRKDGKNWRIAVVMWSAW